MFHSCFSVQLLSLRNELLSNYLRGRGGTTGMNASFSSSIVNSKLTTECFRRCEVCFVGHGRNKSFSSSSRLSYFFENDGRKPYSGGRKFSNRKVYRGHGYDPHREPRSECGYFDGDELYGMVSVRQAIMSGRRDIRELLVQDANEILNKKDRAFAADLLSLANSKGIRIRNFSKHDLNMLTENKNHQGFVLRASPLEVDKIESLRKSAIFKCVLALDAVEDPQNLGSLLRTSYFLGVDRVVTRGTNSAPLSPTVSNISFGASEFLPVNRVDSLTKFLEKSRENGWQIIGTSLGEDTQSLDSVCVDTPTILVLGNEGSGVRGSVLKICTHLVKVDRAPGAADNEELSVDSLNVSTTGGIIIHHFLKGKKRQL